jgi:uncharacterized membrane protein YjjP (DUF1212 family)
MTASTGQKWTSHPASFGALLQGDAMPRAFNRDDGKTCPAPIEAVEALLWFGASMLHAGNSAVRTREWIEVIGRKMGFDAVSVSLSLDTITATVRRDGERTTTMREIGPPGINVWRIAELEQLAKTAGPGLAPREFAVKLSEIDSTTPRYSSVQIAAAVGAASGGFAFLNGAAIPELIAAAIGGGVGQWLRMWLSRRQLNHYGAAALSAVAASGMYVLGAVLAHCVGIQFAHYPAGFIASVLFLIPGFPLIAALFDLLQHQAVVAVSRIAYGVMTLLAVAFGLSIVIAVAGIDLSRQPPPELMYPLKLLLRAVASFVAGCAFAMLFNSSPRTVLAAGLLALGANGLRLALIDMGMMLAPAAFFAALAIGSVAVVADQRFNVPRMAMTVAPTVIMVPGIYAFEMIVLFNQGKMLDALQASASCGFVIGALAMGLATARFSIRRSP